MALDFLTCIGSLTILVLASVVDSLNIAPPKKMPRLSEESSVSKRVDHNLSIRGLSDQLSSNSPRVDPTPPEDGTTTTNGVCEALAHENLQTDRPDSLLGDLNERFATENGRLPTDEEITSLVSRVVVRDDEKGIKHVMHSGRTEFYLIDKLKERLHSFENRTELPNAQTSSLAQFNYPVGRDLFTQDVTVVRAGGELFQRFFGDLKISPGALIKFVLEHGGSNQLRDGQRAVDSGQNRRVTFGCCGSAYDPNEYVEGHCAPHSTYGFEVFDRIEDEAERESTKQMIALRWRC